MTNNHLWELENQMVDYGLPGWVPGPADITRIDTGKICPRLLSTYPGSNGERELFSYSATGRLSETEFADLKCRIRKSGINTITVFVDMDGYCHLPESNHTLRAAIGIIDMVPVEIRYFGGADKINLIFDPEKYSCVAARMRLKGLINNRFVLERGLNDS